METGTFLTKSPNLELYQTDDLRKWIGIYLHACRSRNLAIGTIEFYSKKLGAFSQFCLEKNAANISQISADLIRQFLITLDERGHRPAGIHCYYRSIKTFLKWYERETEPEGWRNPINKVVAPFVPLEPLDPVSIETIKAMLEYYESPDKWCRNPDLLLCYQDTPHTNLMSIQRHCQPYHRHHKGFSHQDNFLLEEYLQYTPQNLLFHNL